MYYFYGEFWYIFNNIFFKFVITFLRVKIELNLLGLLRNNLLIFFVVFCGISSGQESDSSSNDPLAGKKLFNANCAACHKLNKKAVGPALKGVSAKYEKEWLYSWIKNSSAMIKSGDAQAVAIWEEYNKSVMNNFPQLSNRFHQPSSVY